MDTRMTLLDIGGTFIKVSDGSQIPIRSDGSREEIAAALRKAVSGDGVSKIGIAIPGPFDYKEGIFRMEHKFAAVKGESFRALAGVPDNVELKFIHDVNALLLGSICTLGLQDKNVALATIGTGLGFSYSIKGEIQMSETGSPARSLWNLPYEGGILEDKVSARGIRAAYEEKTGEKNQSAYSIAMRAYAGETAAIEVYDNLGDTLGKALAGVLEEIGADILLVGGQISKSLSLMRSPLKNHLDRLRVERAPEGAVFKGLSSLFEND
ncbi:MAG: ROK family protein [Bacteroidales bacterium]|nr:ROK family protein [Bacteroidales bacterium]